MLLWTFFSTPCITLLTAMLLPICVVLGIMLSSSSIAVCVGLQNPKNFPKGECST